MARVAQHRRSPERSNGSESLHDLSSFLSVGPHMIRRSRIASERSVSYRGFRVGATALGFVPGEGYRLWSDANRKLSKNVDKDCAENRVLDQARQAKCARIVGLTVVGTTDIAEIQEVTHAATHTLHPCDSCRDLLADDEMIKPDTLIVTSGLRTDVVEAHSAEELAALYGPDGVYQSNAVEDPDFAGWAERSRQYPLVSAEVGMDEHLAVARFIITGQMPGEAA